MSRDPDPSNLSTDQDRGVVEAGLELPTYDMIWHGDGSPGSPETIDPARQAMLRDIDAILARIDVKLAAEHAALDELLARVTRKPAWRIGGRLGHAGAILDAGPQDRECSGG